MDKAPDSRFVFERYRPHALWGIVFVLVPFGLLMVSLLGLEVGSSIPVAVAANTPRIALALSAAGLALGITQRRSHLIAVGSLGLAISTNRIPPALVAR